MQHNRIINDKLRVANITGLGYLDNNIKKRRSVVGVLDSKGKLQKEDVNKSLDNFKEKTKGNIAIFIIDTVYDFSHLEAIRNTKQGLQTFVIGKRIDEYGKYILETCCEYSDSIFNDNKEYQYKLSSIPFLVRAKRINK